jgi:hypothetical protein
MRSTQDLIDVSTANRNVHTDFILVEPFREEWESVMKKFVTDSLPNDDPAAVISTFNINLCAPWPCGIIYIKKIIPQGHRAPRVMLKFLITAARSSLGLVSVISFS